MHTTISAERTGHNSFRIFLPGDFQKTVQNRRDLRRMLNPYYVYGDRYATFESELMNTGQASTTITFGKFFQVS
jgi:hypothetical protein